MSVGEFFAEHRKSIDARKAHLARVGIAAPDVPLPRDAAGSQADLLTMPTTTERPIIDATHAAIVPAPPGATYEAPRLPKLPGVDADADLEE